MKVGDKRFIRDATGLVRDISPLDAFWMNFYAMNPMLGAVFVFSFSAFVFPAGDMIGGIFLSTLGAVVLAGVYALLTAAMPRSGGDYIFVSRTIHPAIGFGTSINLNFWFLTFFALNTYLVVTFFNSLIRDLGFSSVAESLGAPTPFFALGVVYVAISGILMILGMRTYVKAQLVCAILGILSAFVVIGIFAGARDFPTLFNQYASAYMPGTADPYHTIIESAKQDGVAFSGYDVFQTVGVVAMAFLVMSVPMWSTWSAGEVKRASSVRNQLLAMSGAAIVAGVIFALAAAVVIRATGIEFFTALQYLTFGKPEALGSLPTPYYTSFIPVLVGANVPLLAFINIGFLAAAFVLVPLDITATTRSIFAWSFDRLVPSKLASVNARFAAPVVAIVVNCILGIILWWLLIFTGVFSLIAASLFGVMLSFLFTSIAGVAFPYRLKTVFNASPVKYRLGGVPVVSILGICSLVYLLVMISFFSAFPALVSFAISDITAVLILIMYLIGIGGYFAAKAYWKSKGIDYALVFKEIPPE